VFENRVLSRIFGPMRVEMTEGGRKLAKTVRMGWAGHVARIEAKRNAHSLLVRNPERKRPLGRPRFR
jgi:hypothetical protein